MAVRLRIKNNTEPDQDKAPPKKSESKKVKIRVKTVDSVKEQDKPIKMDADIKGPIGYLNSYFASPMFAQRYKELNKQEVDKSGIEAANKYYKAESGNYDQGIHSRNVGELRQWQSSNKPKGSPTVKIDTAQSKKYKTDVISDVLPHEYTHTARGLNIGEEKLFAEKNKNPRVIKQNPFERFLKSEEYKEETKFGNTENLYSEHLAQKSPDSHDEQPNENYADLNALRFMLYKQGIYDTRKGPMTIEHIKKAMNDPWLKKQFGFQRLLKSFTPEDLVKLNNTIAYNKKSDNQNTV